MGKVMCVFCCEYRDCFKVGRENVQEVFDMCYECAYKNQGGVWFEVNQERKEEVNV